MAIVCLLARHEASWWVHLMKVDGVPARNDVAKAGEPVGGAIYDVKVWKQGVKLGIVFEGVLGGIMRDGNEHVRVNIKGKEGSVRGKAGSKGTVNVLAKRHRRKSSRKSVSIEGHDDGTRHTMVSISNANGAALGCIIRISVESNKAVSTEEGGNGLGDVIGEDEMDDASKGLGIRIWRVFITLWDWMVQGIRLEDVGEVRKGATGGSWFEF
jgi:hypothetical protein